MKGLGNSSNKSSDANRSGAGLGKKDATELGFTIKPESSDASRINENVNQNSSFGF